MDSAQTSKLPVPVEFLVQQSTKYCYDECVACGEMYQRYEFRNGEYVEVGDHKCSYSRTAMLYRGQLKKRLTRDGRIEFARRLSDGFSILALGGDR